MCLDFHTLEAPSRSAHLTSITAYDLHASTNTPCVASPRFSCCVTSGRNKEGGTHPVAAAARFPVSVGAFHFSVIDKFPYALRGCPKMWSACWLVDESPTRP